MAEQELDLWSFMEGIDTAMVGMQKALGMYPRCKFCDSYNVVRNGSRRGTQYYLCRDCGRGFVFNDALPRMRFPIENVASALHMYFAGMSLNDIRHHLEQHGKTLLTDKPTLPSDSAVYGWVVRFTKVAATEAERYTPRGVGDTWSADETVLFIGGRKYWLWDIIDNDTRFLLATHLSPTRTARDAQTLMEKAAKRAGKVPKVVITDKLSSYLDGVELAFGADTEHRRSKPFVDRDSTNIIERWHGSLKDRTKVMRGMKKPETARIILDGWLVYYNFFRPHESLKDRTPAEVAGIQFPFTGWLDVVKSQSPLAQPRIEPAPVSVVYPQYVGGAQAVKRQPKRQRRKRLPPSLTQTR